MAWRTLRQREKADARAHWWDRTRWAIDRAQDPDPAVADVGVEILVVQMRSNLARKEELELMDALYGPVFNRMAKRGAEDPDEALEYLVEDDIDEGIADDDHRA